MQGSANINQRSLAGSRDTEVAVVLHQVQYNEEIQCVCFQFLTMILMVLVLCWFKCL